MGNVINTNSNELNKSDDRNNIPPKSNITNDNVIEKITTRHRTTSLTQNKDNKMLRAQYFNKLNEVKVEKHSVKNTSQLAKEYEMPLTHSFANKTSSPLKSKYY
jgi:hypothetical protein